MSLSIADCRKARGNAKGALTRTANNVNHSLLLPPASLDEAAVTKMKDSLVRADDAFQSHHQLLHVELGELSDDEYLTELQDHQSLFSKALTSVNTLLARIVSLRSLTLAETSLSLSWSW